MTSNDTQRPELRLIQGGGQQPSTWRNPPTTIIGRSPFKRDRTQTYRVAVGDASKDVLVGKRQPILDMWWQIHGQLPPIPGIESLSEAADRANGHGIGQAHASFRGLMRPAGDDNTGFDFIAFVTKPSHMLAYRPSMSCIAELREIPDDIVHVIYVKLDFPDGRRYHKSHAGPICNGIVTHREYVECDPGDKMLPIDYSTRFRKRLW